MSDFQNKSGHNWSLIFGIKMVSFQKGWNSLEEYHDLLISRSEYLNRASISIIEKPKIITRAEIAKFKALLGKTDKKNNN